MIFCFQIKMNFRIREYQKLWLLIMKLFLFSSMDISFETSLIQREITVKNLIQGMFKEFLKML